ncbi:exoskeleton protein RP43-like [Macrobrachium rosenbergii]|uniref:exoskeleton protein RP43-like n=1 Tax=Macrobrachium rosenbergii TaxID=79674 RepID=UPI0034D697E7
MGLEVSVEAEVSPYCGALAVPFTVTVPTNNAELFLYSDGSSLLDGFEATYETVTNTSGEIVVNNALDFTMTCTWKMVMPAGTILRMTFTKFNLGTCCNCAYISIFDNEFTDFPISGSDICGATIPGRIPGTISNSIDITFYTDGSAQYPGFTIQYEALTESQGLLRPSVPPAYYPLSTTCLWTIQLAAGSKIGFFFLWISTESQYDPVTLKDDLTGATLGGGPFSGTPKVPILETSGNLASKGKSKIMITLGVLSSLRDDGGDSEKEDIKRAISDDEVDDIL